MGRRRDQRLNDGSFSSSDEENHEQPIDRGVSQRDLDDEAGNFHDPMHQKRKYTNGKEKALYGSFYDWDSDQEQQGRHGSRGGVNSRDNARRRGGTEFVAASTSAPASASASLKQKVEVKSDEDQHMEEDKDMQSNESSDDEEEEGFRSKRRRSNYNSSKPNQDNSDSEYDSDAPPESDRSEFNEEDEEEDMDQESRQAAFLAQRQKDREEADAEEDRQTRTTMGGVMRGGIGMSSSRGQDMIMTPAPPLSPKSSSGASSIRPSDAAKNKDMASALKASLGLRSSPTQLTTPYSGSMSGSSKTNRGHHSSLSAIMGRVKADSPSPSGSNPSSIPASPASSNFVKSHNGDPIQVATPVKVAKDYGAFSKQGSGFGLKMLQKMGWKEGLGLGTGGTGIVEPIQSKLRPVKMGIGFRGFKEKTDQDRAEEKRRGYVVSSDEDEKKAKKAKEDAAGAKKNKKEQGPKSDGWKARASGSRKKEKVLYKTAHEIQMEIERGDSPMVAIEAPQQKILDMTGKTVRELSSAGQISSAMTYQDDRFPELRYNLSLMADISKTDLEQLVRRQHEDRVQREVLEQEVEKIQRVVSDDEIKIERLMQVMDLADKCAQIAVKIHQESKPRTESSLAVDLQEEALIAAFKDPFGLLGGLYIEEYKTYSLDEVVVGAIQDSFRRLMASWEVLKNPALGASMFKAWQSLLKCSKVTYDQSTIGGGFDGRTSSSSNSAGKMTAYETLLYQHWLPKVRSAINNEWKTQDCEPIITMLEAWAPPLLPVFIHDNIVTQLVMPKLHKAIEAWSPRDTLMIHMWLHPWLPVLGDSRMEQELFPEVRRKLSNGLVQWTVLDPSALRVLTPWSGVFAEVDMEQLLLKSVLPKLVDGMARLEIDPRDQKLELLEAILPWYPFFPSTTFCALLENEFFPKWHHVLYTWLTHSAATSGSEEGGGVDATQVSQWFQWWKSLFPQEILQQPAVAIGFRKGLEMMNQYMSNLTILPVKAPINSNWAQSRQQPGMSPSSQATKAALGRLQSNRNTAPTQLTMQDYLRDYAAQNSLLFMQVEGSKLIQQEINNGRPVYRLGGKFTGTTTSGGVLVQVSDELVFEKDEERPGHWKPIGIDDLMVKARSLDGNVNNRH